MKILKRILLVLLLLILIPIVIIFGLRGVNHWRYKKLAAEQQAVADPQTFLSAESGFTTTAIQEGTLNGYHLKPTDPQHVGLVVTFGGSEGSPNQMLAAAIAKQGYEVLALTFFGQPNQQATLSEIPLDFFSEVLDYAQAHGLNTETLTVIGNSKGAELTANLATLYPEIDNIVLYAPSAYNYTGLDFEKQAGSWTYGGEELPYLNFRDGDFGASMKMMWQMMTGAPVAYRPTYEILSEKASNRDAARIPIETFKGNALIFAGGKDLMWQSERAAEEIGKALGDRAEVHIYPEAGHIFLPYTVVASDFGVLAIGGDEEANRKAGAESDRILSERLALWHSK